MFTDIIMCKVSKVRKVIVIMMICYNHKQYLFAHINIIVQSVWTHENSRNSWKCKRANNKNIKASHYIYIKIYHVQTDKSLFEHIIFAKGKCECIIKFLPQTLYMWHCCKNSNRYNFSQTIHSIHRFNVIQYNTAILTLSL